MTRLVTVGRTASPHGIRGWIKVIPETDDPRRFGLLKSVFLENARGEPSEFAIEGVKYQADRVLLKFAGVDGRDEAAALKNRTVSIPEADVAPISEEDVYYYYQLEGIEVRDLAGETLGKLASIHQTGGNDVYLVRSEDGKKDYLVPALKKCVKSVDLAGGLMTVDRDWVT